MPRARARPTRLTAGTEVAAGPEAFRDADPFTAYRVTRVHKDGTVDLAPPPLGAPVCAHRVDPRHLTVIA